MSQLTEQISNLGLHDGDTQSISYLEAVAIRNLLLHVCVEAVESEYSGDVVPERAIKAIMSIE